ncbi:MAG: mechanosensitive ion channel [Fuerstiella sp.]
MFRLFYPAGICTVAAILSVVVSRCSAQTQEPIPRIYQLTPVDQGSQTLLFESFSDSTDTLLRQTVFLPGPSENLRSEFLFVSPSKLRPAERPVTEKSGSGGNVSMIAAPISMQRRQRPSGNHSPTPRSDTPPPNALPPNTLQPNTLQPNTSGAASAPGDAPVAVDDQSAINQFTTVVQSAPVEASAPLVQATAEAEAGGLKPAAVIPVAADVDAPPRLSAALIEERRRQVESAELADDVKTAVLTQYQQAAEMLRRVEEVVRKTAELRAEKERGPQTLAEIRAQLAQSAERAEPGPEAAATISELEQLRLMDEERLVEARKALDAWEQRAKVRTERKPQMPALIEKTKQQLADARKSMSAAGPDGETATVAQARRTEQEAFVLLLQSQLELYQTEMARYEALSELFPLQRDSLLRNRNALEKRSEAWKAVLLEAGRRETERQAAEARRKLQNAHPALRELAERNTELTRLRTQLQDLLASTRGKLDAIRKTFDRVESDFTNVKDKEQRAGLTTAIGILLRNQRNHLPPDGPYREHRRHAESEMARLQLEQMPLEDQRDDLGDTVALAETIVARIDDPGLRNDVDISAMTLSLLNDRKKYLDDLLADYDACIKELAELDVRSRKLVETTSAYRTYIDERVLWIRSAGLVGLDTPRQALTGLGDIARPDRWYQMGQTLVADVMRMPLLTSLIVFALLCLLALRSRMRTWIRTLIENARRESVVGALTTVSAILLTLAVASVWPLVLWLTGRQLASEPTDEFGMAVGESLKTTSLMFWSIEILRQICGAGGIAAQHLKWPVLSVRSLHANLLTLMTFGLPLAFGVCLAERWQDGAWAGSLGRILFVSGMLLVAAFTKRVLRPEGRVLSEVLQQHHDGWLYRARRVWYPMAVAVPLLLAGMAIAGYQFTAQQLLFRVELTCWLLIGLLITFSLTMRWLITARRKLALEQARARATARAAEAEAHESRDSLSPLPRVEEPRIDFSMLSDQMLKLVRVVTCVLFLSGGWFIWGEVLPALQVFNRVELWHTTVQVAEEVEVPEGPSETRLVTKPHPITLGSLLLAAGFLIVSTAASRNIPGLLELSLLQRLPLDHGGRNAITTLCRYALTLGGVVLAAQTIGIGWSSVQWLLAALTVGLGFGLQEIFANFVSGLIILFERPVRIGDVVTIDGVSGSVSRIQIRATTITDFDRKEYIVPNKEFVTGRVLNWTLSDKTNRIVITVGVAYGSNTELARGLLVKAATDHALVLEDPPPVATFEGFGDSCLTLLLRCFLPSLENRLKTITELHEAIDREFKANGLEIAFPQRDIHVRSMMALPISLPASQQATQTSQSDQSDEKKVA